MPPAGDCFVSVPGIAGVLLECCMYNAGEDLVSVPETAGEVLECCV